MSLSPEFVRMLGFGVVAAGIGFLFGAYWHAGRAARREQTTSDRPPPFPPPGSSGFARVAAGLQGGAVHDFDLCLRCSDTAGLHMEPYDGFVPRQWSKRDDIPCRRPGCDCPGFQVGVIGA